MGIIVRISGPVVIAEDVENAKMFDVVRVGELGLVGEIIRIIGNRSTIQVYEDTSGIRPGEKVENTSRPLSVDLGPGLLTSIYDGIQRPLDVIRAKTGDFIQRGFTASPLSEEKAWDFKPKAKKGDKVEPGQIIGTVPETGIIEHRVMVPYGVSGKIAEIREGKFKVSDVVATIDTGSSKVEVKLKQEWPVRIPRKVLRKLPPELPLITGQRVIDTFFPVAKGGTVAVPGPFGSGKCVTGDTPVLLGDGSIKEIRELYEEGLKAGVRMKLKDEEYISLQKPVELMSFHEGKIQKSSSSMLYKGKSDTVVRVRTGTGREVRVTPVHKLFRLSDTGEIVETEARDLSPGDFIVSAKSTEFSQRRQKIDIYTMGNIRALDGNIQDEIAEILKLSYKKNMDIHLPAWVKHSLSRSENRITPRLSWIKEIYSAIGRSPPRPRMLVGDRNSSPVSIPEFMNEDLAEFIGYYLFEGYIRGNGTVVFTNNDEKLLERFTALAHELFSITGIREIQRGKVPNILLHSRVLVQFLDSMSTGKDASTKKIPEIIMKSGDSVISSFLTAYFAGAGSFSKESVEFSAASKWLAAQLSYVLTRFGIISSKSFKNVNGREYQRISVRGKTNLAKLGKIMKTEHTKVEKMNSYSASAGATYDSINIVPFPASYSDSLYGSHTSYSELPDEGIEISNHTRNSEHMGVETFRKFSSITRESAGSQVLEEPSSSLSEPLDHIYFDRIISLEEETGPFDVYDVTVPDSGRNFVGGYGGILLHNTVVQHQLSKWADSDIVVYVGCGERGNEMTEILTSFPELTDPKSGKPLMERTVLIANTSNMPVAAREASIYTGITIAEYYRDMGYNVALMADSTSRWAEALREISGRLEEMPGEEGYPAYLGRRLSEFYERSGNAIVVSDDQRNGSITIVGAVSPPGGDTSEPVSQNTLRVTRVFWALDSSLASRRHFPSINWLNSYSLYQDDLRKWFEENVTKNWGELYDEAMGILQKESELQEVVQLVGFDALPEREKNTLDIARMIREDFLQQSAFDEVDQYCSIGKQYRMLNAILTLGREQSGALDKGLQMGQIQSMGARSRISRMKEVREDEFQAYYDSVMTEMKDQIGKLLEVQ